MNPKQRHLLTLATVLAVMSGQASQQQLRRGQPNRRILATRTAGGVEASYHATKGWRTRTLPRDVQVAA